MTSHFIERYLNWKDKLQQRTAISSSNKCLSNDWKTVSALSSLQNSLKLVETTFSSRPFYNFLSWATASLSWSDFLHSVAGANCRLCMLLWLKIRELALISSVRRRKTSSGRYLFLSRIFLTVINLLSMTCQYRGFHLISSRRSS